ncbi:DUF1613-domain-containing protein [Lichtheimia hyalospora FSU 10163]|nr:DUF1613-domain-containing protein [Lichtheimia hyalospora FSU 10163]
MAQTTIDPSTLFAQFAPDLYFENPVPITHDDDPDTWYLIAQQIVPTSKFEFWATIKRWTDEPQHVIPPVDKAIRLGRSTDNIIYRQLVPKRKSKDDILTEIVTYQDERNRVIYQPDRDQSLPFYYPKVKSYSFVYIESPSSERQGTLRLEIIPLHTPAIEEKKMQYALKMIFHKLFKWCIQARIGYKKKAFHDVLVPKDTYTDMYQKLKSKYAQDLVKGWTEKTDPSKFVFEDIAIASYLICLWQQEERKPRFVDLGCGNGLLTFLLTSEGYQGYGIDIAERKIWSKLRNGNNDLLRVQSLYPSQSTFPDADWLIGNHADELVPWIPVIAHKSNAQCKFFVIPCCFYALDGTRTLALGGAPEGKYKAYTNYIKGIIGQCGFECEQDYLRIPSTKNIALVGRRRLTHINANVKALEENGSAFVPRKSDREKEEIRRSLKRAKIERQEDSL